LAKRHIAATTKQSCFGQPKALFKVIGEFRKAKEVVPLPRSQRRMRFALFASAKFAGRWGQGLAIIVFVVAIVGVIGSPKGFGQISGSILGSLKVAFGC
jgi:hypothetical protein